MSIKGFLYFDLNCWNVDQRTFLLQFRLLKYRSRGFSNSIWTVEISIKGLFYFDLDCWNIDQKAFLFRFGLLKCRSKGFFTSNINWRAFLLQFGLAGTSIKGLFYFNLDCWNVNHRASLLWSCRCLQKVKIWD